MEDFNYGELVLVQIALLKFIGDLDLTLGSGVAVQQVLGKTEYKINALNAAAIEQLPKSLAPTPEGPK